MPQISHKPRVSIVIPYYNAAEYVGDTLESVFSQTYRDFEVILVNDGSPDTPELLKAISPWIERIVYFEISNQGPSTARNKGILASQGELLAFLDSDDLWEPNYLEVQVQKLDENPSADIVYSGSTAFGECASRPGQSLRGPITFTSLIDETYWVGVTVVARRQALIKAGLFDPNIWGAEDFDLWLRCIKNGSQIIAYGTPLFRYRVRKGSNSSDPIWMASHTVKVLEKIRTLFELSADERKVLEAAIRKQEGLTLYFEAKRAFMVEDFALARERLRAANRVLPSIRNSLILPFIALMPRLTRTFYIWRSRNRISRDTFHSPS